MKKNLPKIAPKKKGGELSSCCRQRWGQIGTTGSKGSFEESYWKPDIHASPKYTARF